MPDSLQQIVDDYISSVMSNKTQSKKLGISGLVKDEVENLKNCILQFVQSDTVRNAITVKENSDGTYTIGFNESKATLPSTFSGYPTGAYMPILRNDGYEIKHPFYKKFFGKGAKGRAQGFIESGIAEYKRKYGDGLQITVSKLFDEKYSPYNSTISEETEY